MADFKPTEQQQEILDRTADGWSFVVEAGAGTGKTSTIAQAARVSRATNGLYLAYNKAIVEDSKGQLPDSVTSSTAHSLAYRAVGYQYRHVLSQGALQGWQLAKSLGIRKWASGDCKLSGPAQASLARRTITHWARGTDLEIGAQHVIIPESITDAEIRDELREIILAHALRLWYRVGNPAQTSLRFDHDWYLKLFSMCGYNGAPPVLPYDLVLFDECQDADPVISLIFESQPGCQRLAIGDSNQSIYQWRGARNAIAKFREAGAPMFPLSVSWRFGQIIADEANVWLDQLDAELRLTGNPGIESTIGPIDRNERHTVLSRTNAGVMETVIGAVRAGMPVAMVGCGSEVKSLARGCVKLHEGSESDHPELIGFSSWDDLVNFAGSEECNNPTLRTLVRLSATHGVSGLSTALHSCTTEKEAHVIASTAHKAKGRQWAQVKIGSDFAAVKPKKGVDQKEAERAEMRLSYVAVTRARKRLDTRGLEAIEAPSSSGFEFDNFSLF